MKTSEIAERVVRPNMDITGGPVEFTADELRYLARAYLEQRDTVAEMIPAIRSIEGNCEDSHPKNCLCGTQARNIAKQLAAAMEE